MAELASFTVRDQGAVVFEIDGDEDGLIDVGFGRIGRVVDLQQSFESKLAGIRDAAVATLSILREDLVPDEVTLRFGIKMTAEAGAVIARTTVEGNMEVEMAWRNERQSEASGSAPAE
jgi:hypothetical protein